MTTAQAAPDAAPVRRAPSDTTRRIGLVATIGLIVVLLVLTGFAGWVAVTVRSAAIETTLASDLSDAYRLARDDLRSQQAAVSAYQLDPQPATRMQFDVLSEEFGGAVAMISAAGGPAAIRPDLLTLHAEYDAAAAEVFAAIDRGDRTHAQEISAAVLHSLANRITPTLEGETQVQLAAESKRQARLLATARLVLIVAPLLVVLAVGLTFIFAGVLRQYQRRESKSEITRLRSVAEAEQRAIAAREQRFRALIEHSTDALALVDGQGRIKDVGPSISRLLGYGAEELIGSNSLDLIHPEDRARAWHSFGETARHPGVSSTARYRIRCKDGSWRWMEGTATNLLEDPAVRAIVGNYRDIDDWTHAQEALRASEERYRSLIELSPAPITVHRAGRFVFVNAAAAQLYGAPSATDVIGKPVLDFVPPAIRDRVECRIRFGYEGITAPRRMETTILRTNGDTVEVEIDSMTVAYGEGPATLTMFHDITERKRAEVMLRHAALHDPLTGLPNRTLLAERITRAIARGRHDPAYRCALLYLDFDRFKSINDRFGHGCGDQVLIEGGRRLRQCLRPTDTLARLGGDEFALLFEDVAHVEEAEGRAEDVCNALAAPLFVQTMKIPISASIGVIVDVSGYDNADDLVRDADTAMYQAKALGKARCVIFDEAMRVDAVAHLQLETDLRRALEQEEFTQVYQPIVAIESGEMVGVEALVRWRHPTRGAIAPYTFLPLAEETGLIVPLDRWGLGAACAQMRRWSDRCLLPERFAISVNVSGKGLVQPDFAAYVLETVHNAGIAPERLMLEITESDLVAPADIAVEGLRTLSAAGIAIQLDDFGVGYSSLNYLNRLPIGQLKIDRSFISAEGGVAVENVGIVRSVVALAHQLHIGVTAEGVETETQRSQLAALDCDYAQGYLFAAPHPADEIERLLLAREATRGAYEVETPTASVIGDIAATRALDLAGAASVVVGDD